MPRILVLCPDYEPPAGGIRKLYRHVDVLSGAGFEAAVLHHQPGFRCSWFPSTTPVLYAPQTPFRRGDVLVIPEVYGPDLGDIGPGLPKVVFNQNAYLTFSGYRVDPHDLRTAYRHRDVVAAFVVSEDNRDYLAYAFPKLRLFRLHYGIDAALFAPRSPKKKLVTFMPRKNAQEVVQVVNLLKHRRALEGFELAAIEGRTEAQVAALQGEALVFLSFGHPEGCPLPPLEAMASGCLVVGYHGRGGREYFKEEFCRPVEAGDVVGFARAAEQVLELARRDQGAVQEMGRRAGAFVREHYSVRREEQDILAVWRTLLGTR